MGNSALIVATRRGGVRHSTAATRRGSLIWATKLARAECVHDAVVAPDLPYEGSFIYRQLADKHFFRIDIRSKSE